MFSQVGFHSQKRVKKIRVEKRENAIINRLNKTKVEKEHVDFRTQREERDAKERQAKKKAFKAMEEQRKQDEEKRKAEAELR